MHVVTLGAPEGTPLVLLHMTPQSYLQFERFAPHFADRPVVIPDRLGFGFSDKLSAPIPFEAYAAATREALDALGIERFDVLGVHTGSSEAIELAATLPQRVRKVVVVAVPAFSEEDLEEFRLMLRSPPAPRDDGSHLLSYWRWSCGKWQPQLDGERWTAADVHRQVLQNMLAAPHAWWTYQSVFAYPAGERARSLRQPLLVLAPHDDIYEPTRRLAPELGPNARVVDLPHMQFEVITVHHEELADIVRGFLDEEAP
jgi:pimeloyl-ACP methyl ester carboxylesterase